MYIYYVYMYISAEFKFDFNAFTLILYKVIWYSQKKLTLNSIIETEFERRERENENLLQNICNC